MLILFKGGNSGPDSINHCGRLHSTVVGLLHSCLTGNKDIKDCGIPPDRDSKQHLDSLRVPRLLMPVASSKGLVVVYALSVHAQCQYLTLRARKTPSTV